MMRHCVIYLFWSQHLYSSLIAGRFLPEPSTLYFPLSTFFFCEMVPRAGLEPAQSLDHEILSLARMPISPPRLQSVCVLQQA